MKNNVLFMNLRERKIFTGKDLQQITAGENSEPLMDLHEACTHIICEYKKFDMVP